MGADIPCHGKDDRFPHMRRFVGQFHDQLEIIDLMWLVRLHLQGFRVDGLACRVDGDGGNCELAFLLGNQQVTVHVRPLLNAVHSTIYICDLLARRVSSAAVLGSKSLQSACIRAVRLVDPVDVNFEAERFADEDGS